MTELLLIVIFGGILVYVIWRFTANKGTTTHGIEVVTQGAKNRIDEGDEILEEKNNENGDGESSPAGEKSFPKKMRMDVEQECIEMIVKDPKDINAYLKLSAFYIQRKKWKDAKEVLLEAVKINEDNDKVNNNLGVVWYKLKRYNNAVNAFEKSLKANDKIPHRYMNMGLTWVALGENAKASEYFSKAVALDPEQKDYQELLTEVKSMLV